MPGNLQVSHILSQLMTLVEHAYYNKREFTASKIQQFLDECQYQTPTVTSGSVSR